MIEFSPESSFCIAMRFSRIAYEAAEWLYLPEAQGKSMSCQDGDTRTDMKYDA